MGPAALRLRGRVRIITEEVRGSGAASSGLTSEARREDGANSAAKRADGAARYHGWPPWGSLGPARIGDQRGGPPGRPRRAALRGRAGTRARARPPARAA